MHLFLISSSLHIDCISLGIIISLLWLLQTNESHYLIIIPHHCLHLSSWNSTGDSSVESQFHTLSKLPELCGKPAPHAFKIARVSFESAFFLLTQRDQPFWQQFRSEEETSYLHKLAKKLALKAAISKNKQMKRKEKSTLQLPFNVNAFLNLVAREECSNMLISEIAFVRKHQALRTGKMLTVQTK